jgi:hypothetical protein
MVIKSYIDKCNSIISASTVNTGLNPVCELNYGANLSRVLIHFPLDKITEKIKDKTCPNIDKFKHVLHMTNAGSVDFTQLHCAYESRIGDSEKIRASSFDLIFSLIPNDFDEGKGWDEAFSFFNQGYHDKYCDGVFSDTFKLISEDGSNWFQSKNGYEWANKADDGTVVSSITECTTTSITSDYRGNKVSSVTSSITTDTNENGFYGKTDDGVYSIKRLSKEYEKYSEIENNSNIIIGRQHFDAGNENIELDITETVNKMLDGDLCNYGIMISYSPMLEWTSGNSDNYTGFFTNHTNTFFEPYLETTYHDTIEDDRNNFALDKENRLYLYSTINGNPENLDDLPICSINGKNYPVTHQSKGIYFASVTLLSKDVTAPAMYYDEWSGLYYNGTKLEDVELYFTIKPPSVYFNIGNGKNSAVERYAINLSGIKDNEKINRNSQETRKIVIDTRIPYSSKANISVSNMELRLYVKDGEGEITVIDWDDVNRTYLENNYLLRLCDLIPNDYFIDVRLKYNGETITHKKVGYFSIVNDKTNKYF